MKTYNYIILPGKLSSDFKNKTVRHTYIKFVFHFRLQFVCFLDCNSVFINNQPQLVYNICKYFMWTVVITCSWMTMKNEMDVILLSSILVSIVFELRHILSCKIYSTKAAYVEIRAFYKEKKWKTHDNVNKINAIKHELLLAEYANKLYFYLKVLSQFNVKMGNLFIRLLLPFR